ncbi:hypothetical protein POJ06DRAFT_273040 [Lipomyces tetrasporus]|uniref:Uncharacterized protein n=1 Tax=Lipomyces tetrasporus TaxID=54092 RepID=A0AAD7QVV3_9ASCO|nr:uncharacterized protein POJ06DRAFT_273040 [Lipomyces tetrasporus]KAJ8102403.1 hypothetical protein POJ06DRAFT_273040 [Lipomyces tetrasporus]
MAAVALQGWIEGGMRTELRNRGMGDLSARFSAVYDLRLNALDDQLWLSVKKTDGALIYVKDGFETVIAVIEIGVSESYRRLTADLELWMQVFQCHTGLLFSLSEKPKFRYPTGAVSANDVVPFGNAMAAVNLNQPFGPYHYNGHDWFGKLGAAFMELYRRDPLTGTVLPPTRFNVVEDGQMLLQGANANLGLTIADLFPAGEQDIHGIEAALIHLDADRVRELLGRGALITAKSRFTDAVGHR